uniref:Cell division cycle protein 27 homolog n=1 Tax=Heterorhabditis bacteriophora TaxID=37862 RepID=A0A1I7WP52_HETBA
MVLTANGDSNVSSYCQIKNVIQECLDHCSYDDALFLSELFHEKDDKFYAFYRNQSTCESGRTLEAIEECGMSIEKNTFLWSSISNYVQYGGRDVAKLFVEMNNKLFPDDLIDKQKEGFEEIEKEHDDTSVLTKKTPIVNTSVPKVQLHAPRKSTRISEASETRRVTRLFSQDSENAGSRNRANNHSKVHKVIYFLSSNKQLYKILEVYIRKLQVILVVNYRKPRDKEREVKQPLGSRSANAMRSLSSSSNSVSSVSSSTAPLHRPPTKDTDEKTEQFTQLFKDLYICIKSLSVIEEAVGTYKWQSALDLLSSLPWSIGKHAVAMQLRARIMFELAEYASARDILVELRRTHPHRVDGMELLSTAMWHLQDSHALSSLAQSLTTTARLRPQSWCAAGNCFSLQRQHAQAVECMERAIQLDSHFAYAYTLLGHELIFQEELDKAAKSFRSALSISPNDYRAWHGLGLVHLRKEQMGLAQVNISKAVSINSTNRAMLCQLAQVEQALNRPEKAMKLIDKALTMNPNDVACRYNRARLLFETKRNEECVKELTELKGVSPDEAYIFHLLVKLIWSEWSFHYNYQLLTMFRIVNLVKQNLIVGGDNRTRKWSVSRGSMVLAPVSDVSQTFDVTKAFCRSKAALIPVPVESEVRLIYSFKSHISTYKILYSFTQEMQSDDVVLVSDDEHEPYLQHDKEDGIHISPVSKFSDNSKIQVHSKCSFYVVFLKRYTYIYIMANIDNENSSKIRLFYQVEH